MIRGSSYPSWFEKIFGFREELETESKGAFERVQAAFDYDPDARTLRSRHNGAVFATGTFSTPSVGELRKAAQDALYGEGIGSVSVDHVAVGDILEEHARHPHALFQAASQLNCLEMASRSVTPEDGITGYQFDFTQGPACAMACAAGTLFRNYFVNVGALSIPRSSDGLLGQRADRQVNTLDGVEAAVRTKERGLWSVRNGYLCPAPSKVDQLSEVIGAGSHRDDLLALLKIGLHADVGVTFARGASLYEPPARPVTVSQAYCSAMPIGYKDGAGVHPLARLLLDGVYEATLWAAVLNAARTGCPDVFLTFVGGGVWGNDIAWIADAIGRAIALVKAHVRGHAVALHVHICHFRKVDARTSALVDEAIAAAERSLGH